jgi:post-segregation antitoxin (ccd killing protein)
MQVYLPQELYDSVKSRGLPVSELLQRAVQVELRRQDLLAATDKYLAELVAEVGPPSDDQSSRARTTARRITKRSVRKAG